MRRRTLESHGAFIEPCLKKGLRVLDLGCGPGTISLGIAQRVEPSGSVVGVDSSEAQFDEARAGSEGLPITFQKMDAYQLDFADESFDGVFAHALFEHLAHPQDALLEVKRVLKPDGFIGLRSPDWGGAVLHPCDEKLKAALIAREELQTRNGGHIHAGRQLGHWLRQAGFTSIKISASYEIYPDNAPIVGHLATQMESNGLREHASTWRKWGENPTAIFAQAWFEAVGQKDISDRRSG
jgi:ubiquinone/menaquinone biosynthesis C-methylase UbiE